MFYYFALLGFGIAEYNDWPIIEKKNQVGGSVPENGRKSWKMKSIVLDLSEKIMACMEFGLFLYLAIISTGQRGIMQWKKTLYLICTDYVDVNIP